jgi:DNA mismatch endonuclease (patch repair protein)
MENIEFLPVDETRSQHMAAIWSRDTATEVRFRKGIWAAGVRAHRRNGQLQEKPDIVFHLSRLAIFVNGYLWHQFPNCFQMPKTRLDYWRPKIARNVARDAFVNRTLRREGRKVLRFWEHEIHHDLATCIQRVSDAIPYASADLHLATKTNRPGKCRVITLVQRRR